MHNWQENEIKELLRLWGSEVIWNRSTVVGLWDEVDERERNKHLGPVEVEDDEDQYRTFNTSKFWYL